MQRGRHIGFRDGESSAGHRDSRFDRAIEQPVADTEHRRRATGRIRQQCRQSRCVVGLFTDQQRGAHDRRQVDQRSIGQQLVQEIGAGSELTRPIEQRRPDIRTVVVHTHIRIRRPMLRDDLQQLLQHTPVLRRRAVRMAETEGAARWRIDAGRTWIGGGRVYPVVAEDYAPERDGVRLRRIGAGIACRVRGFDPGRAEDHRVRVCRTDRRAGAVADAVRLFHTGDDRPEDDGGGIGEFEAGDRAVPVQVDDKGEVAGAWGREGAERGGVAQGEGGVAGAFADELDIGLFAQGRQRAGGEAGNGGVGGGEAVDREHTRLAQPRPLGGSDSRDQQQVSRVRRGGAATGTLPARQITRVAPLDRQQFRQLVLDDLLHPSPARRIHRRQLIDHLAPHTIGRPEISRRIDTHPDVGERLRTGRCFEASTQQFASRIDLDRLHRCRDPLERCPTRGQFAAQRPTVSGHSR